MANGKVSQRKLIHALLVIIICLSVFYVSDGNKQARKRKDEKSVIKRYCGAMVWFDRRQKKMCEKFPTLIEIVKTAVDKALEQCRAQFKWYRWNCSPLTWNQVFAEDGILKRRSKETAFVQALTTASVMMEISKKCAEGKLKNCGCGTHPKQSPRRNAKRAPKFAWDGCPHNFKDGAHMTKRFMDPRKIINHSRKTKLHNNEVGRKIVRQLKKKKCQCHGKSNTCTYKTCWYVSPTIEDVAQHMWKLYKSPVRSEYNRTENTLYDKERSKREKTQEKIDKVVLTYFEKSEDFCVKDLDKGIMGTRGRTCNSTSNGVDSCKTMCCGRKSQKNVVTKMGKCNCRFVWCCNVECDTCMKKEVVETCL